MNYVGIDISKYKHDCFIMTNLGEVVNGGFSFANNAEGFAMLERELALCGKDNTRIGFEATGNYGINLKLFLERIGYDYMEINPLLIKSKSLRRTKTDKLDCIFPEFKPLFHNKFSVTSLYILANYPSPKAIANMNVCSYDILRRKSHGKFTMDMFVKLKELAVRFIFISHALELNSKCCLS